MDICFALVKTLRKYCFRTAISLLSKIVSITSRTLKFKAIFKCFQHDWDENIETCFLLKLSLKTDNVLSDSDFAAHVHLESNNDSSGTMC